MMHRKRMLTVTAVGTLAAALILTGCTSSPDPSSPDAGGTLRLGVVTPLSSFAPWEAGWANQSPYLQAVYDTLLRANPDGEITEGLATEWAWDENRTQLTLTLRGDVEFSDGTPLTAEVAAGNLIRFRDGTSESAPFLAGLVSAEASDEQTLVITLAEPDPAFLVYLTQNAGLVGAEAMWASADAQTTPIGTGAYELDQESTVVGSTYAYTAKDDYWDAEWVQYDEIVISLYGDATSLMNAVKGGQVDATASQTPTQIAEAEAAGFTANTSEQDWTGFLLVDRLGQLNPALGDVRVRQAFNYALDREGLVQALAGGYGTATTQVFAVASDAYDPELDDRYPYDTEKAKELLADAGYAAGLTLVMPRNDFVPEAEFAIYAEQLGAVGIKVEWEQTADDLFPRMLGGSWAAFPFRLQTDPTAWQTMQFSMLASSPWNTFHVEDPQITEFRDQMRAVDAEESEQIGRDLNAYIVEQAWYAPTFRPETAFFTNAATETDLQVGNAYPYLWNFRPAS